MFFNCANPGLHHSVCGQCLELASDVDAIVFQDRCKAVTLGTLWYLCVLLRRKDTGRSDQERSEIVSQKLQESSREKRSWSLAILSPRRLLSEKESSCSTTPHPKVWSQKQLFD